MESSTEPPWPDSLPAGPSEFRRKVESRSLAGSAGDTNLTMRHCRQLRAQGQPHAAASVFAAIDTAFRSSEMAGRKVPSGQPRSDRLAVCRRLLRIMNGDRSQEDRQSTLVARAYRLVW
jgi:hypothetical protein